MNTKTIDSAYAGSVYTFPLHRRIASWLHKLKPWIASAALWVGMVYMPHIYNAIKGLL